MPGAHIDIEERAQIRHDRLVHKFSIAAIMKTFSRSRNAINGALAEGPVGRTGGRKLSSTIARRDLIKKLVRQKKSVNGRILPRYPSAECVRMAVNAAGFKACRSTIHTDLSETCVNRVRPKQPFDGEHCVLLRKALKRKANRMRGWDKYVFSDEHWITVNDHTTRTQWVVKRADGTINREDLVPIIRRSRYNIPSFMVWAAIGVNFKSRLIFIPRKKDEEGKVISMNSSRYIRVCLASILNGSNQIPHDAILMQDGARCHTAKATLAYLSRKGQMVLEDWPPYSPDLNPIEYLWAHLDKKISEEAPQTADQLEAVAKRVWDAIPQAVINNYVLGFKGLLKDHVSA